MCNIPNHVNIQICFGSYLVPEDIKLNQLYHVSSPESYGRELQSKILVYQSQHLTKNDRLCAF